MKRCVSRYATLHLCALAAMASIASPAVGRVTKIVVDETLPLTAVPGQSIAYEQVAGRAFGELDPKDPLNAIIQDIDLGKGADGKAHYVATFVLTKPVDMAKASGLLWHDVPNRGNPFVLYPQERAFGDVGLASAWQGDNAGNTAVRATMQVNGRHFVDVPVARNPDGSAITGPVLARIVNRAGASSQPLLVQSNPVPYKPASLDTRAAKMVTRERETMNGEVTGEAVVPATDWAWAHCSAGEPFPGTPDPTQICVKGGFDPAKLYQVVFTAKDPYVLGVGFAAWRDVAVFFKTARADDAGTPNPLAGRIRFSIGRGVSQSGNFLRGSLHLGFNQAEGGARVHDGLWPIIAGRRIALNFRWAQPDGVLELYQAGSEGPQWWSPHDDPVRALPRAGILDRCNKSNTCPKIVEHFGSAEVWALKLTPEWVGTDARADLPLPANVRRYYIASTGHGGGAGGFNSSLKPAPVTLCPGNNYGAALLPTNPVPHTETMNALRVHFRNWVMRDQPPPESVYPRLQPLADDGKTPLPPQLVDAHHTALGFPLLPGLRSTIPEPGFINPVLDYDWGPQFDPMDVRGVPTQQPPPVKRVIRMLAPRVDADGNEVGGVPVVLTGAPLGTYLGWNVTADDARPFHNGQLCNYAGGMLPFARTRAERLANNDPRLSLEERYGDHTGYVAAVRKAAADAVARGFLLPADAEALIASADASDVLK
jgi:hypothetical protein